MSDKDTSTKAPPRQLIELGDFLNDRRDIYVEFVTQGQEVEVPVSYNPGIMVGDYAKRFEVAPDAEVVADLLDDYGIDAPEDLAAEIVAVLNARQDASDEVAIALSDMVLDIGIGHKGEQMPTTPEGFEALPVAVRGKLFRSIMEDMNEEASGQEKKASSAPWAKKPGRRRKKRRSNSGGSF